jgi:hypothetical protein
MLPSVHPPPPHYHHPFTTFSPNLATPLLSFIVQRVVCASLRLTVSKNGINRKLCSANGAGKSRLYAKRGKEPVLLGRDASSYPRKTEFPVTPL